VRANAARVLSRLESLPAEAIAPLAECALDGDDGVRLSAGLALRLAPPAEAVKVFRGLLADPIARLRLLAAGTLLEANPANAEAVLVLVGLLDDSSPRIREAAVELIDSLGAGGLAFIEELRRRQTEELGPELSDLLAEVLEHLEQRQAAVIPGSMQPEREMPVTSSG
jgi:HEAT repeat protein